MTRSFNLTANLNIKGPHGIKEVVSEINTALSNIRGKITLNITPQAIANISNFKKNLDRLQLGLYGVSAAAGSATTALKDFNTVVRNIGRRTTSARTQLESLRTSTKNAGSAMENFGRQSAMTVQRFGAFTVATASIFRFISASKQAFLEAVDFERQMVKIAQVSNQTTGQLRPLENEVGRLSTKYGVSSKKLIEASQVMAQAGISAKDVKTALETLAQTELAPTFEKSADTVEAMISIMQQFGVQAKDFNKVFGSINTVAAQFAVEADDITTAIRKIGASFKVTNDATKDSITQLQELISLFTSVRHTTREGPETIATGLRTIFVRMQRQSTLDFLQDQGINLRKPNRQFVGGFEAVGRLHKGLANVPTNDSRFLRIAEELGGYRQIQKVIPLIQQFPLALRAMNVAQMGTTSLARDAAKAQESLQVQLAKVYEEFNKLFRLFTHNIFLRSIITGVKELTTALVQAGHAIEPILGIGALFAAKNVLGPITNFSRGFASVFTGAATNGGAINVAGAANSTKQASLQVVATQQNTVALERSSYFLEMLVRRFYNLSPNTALLPPSDLNSGNGGGGGSNTTNTGNTQRRRNPNFRRNLGYGIGAALIGLPYITHHMGEDANLINEGLGVASLTALSTTFSRGGNRFGLRNFGRSGPFSRRNNIRAAAFFNKSLIPAGVGIAGIGGILGSHGHEEAGTVASYAGIGLAAGAMFSPLGAAIGAAAGSLIGLAMAAKQARISEEQKSHASTITALSSVLDNVAGGKTTIGAGSPSIRSKIVATQSSLNTASSDTYEQLVTSIQNEVPKLENFGVSLVETSKDLKDFETRQGGVGKKLLEILSFATDTPMKELRKQFEEQIKVQQNAVAIQQKLNAAQNELFEETSKFLHLNAALRQASYTSGRTSAAIIGFGHNQHVPFQGISNIANLQHPLQVINSRQFGGLIGQITPNAGMSSLAQTIATTFQKLPHILLAARSEGIEGDVVENKVGEALKDVPHFLREQILSLLQHEYLGGDEGSSAKLFKAIDDDVLKVTDTLFSYFKPIFTALHEGGTILHQEIDRLGANFEKLVDMQLKYVEGLKKVQSIGLKGYLQNRGLRQLPPDVGNVDNLANGIRNATLSGTGFNSGSSAAALGNRLIQLQQDEINQREKLNKLDAHDGDAITKAQKALADLKKEAVQLTKALEDNEDIQAMINAREQRVSTLTQGRERRLDIVKQLFSSSPRESIDLRRNVAAAAMIAKTGRISNLPMNLRAGGMQMLESFGTSPFTQGGKPANILLKEAIGNEMRGQGVPEDVIKGFMEATGEEEKLIKEIQDLVHTEESRASELNRVLDKQIGSLTKSLDEQFKNFLSEFLDLQRQAINKQVDIKTGQISGKMQALGNSELALIKVEQKFGNVGKARAIANAGGQIVDINKTKGTLEAIKNAKKPYVIKGETTHNEMVQQVKNRYANILLPSQMQALSRKLTVITNGNVKMPESEAVAKFNNTILPTLNNFLKPIVATKEKELSEKTDDLAETFGQTKEGVALFKQALSQTTKSLDDLGALLDKLEGINGQKDIDLKGKALENELNTNEAMRVQRRAGGGPIFQARGTDTVPAMLTPGEFVVNRRATQENMGLLEAINSGDASYFAIGGHVHTNKKRSGEYQRVEHHYLSAEEKRQNLIDRRTTKRQIREHNLQQVRNKAAAIRERQFEQLVGQSSVRNFLGGMPPVNHPLMKRRKPRRLKELLADLHPPQEVPFDFNASNERIEQARRDFYAHANKATESSHDYFTKQRPYLEEKRKKLNYQREKERFVNRYNKALDTHDFLTNLNNFSFKGYVPRESVQAAGKSLVDIQKMTDQAVRYRLRRDDAHKTGRYRLRSSTNLAKGGIVTQHLAGGGAVSNTHMDFSAIERSFTSFASVGGELAKAIAGMPHSISLEGKQTVEVILNGAEVLTHLQPEIGKMVERQIKNAIQTLYNGPLSGQPRP